MLCKVRGLVRHYSLYVIRQQKNECRCRPSKANIISTPQPKHLSIRAHIYAQTSAPGEEHEHRIVCAPGTMRRDLNEIHRQDAQTRYGNNNAPGLVSVGWTSSSSQGTVVWDVWTSAIGPSAAFRWPNKTHIAHAKATDGRLLCIEYTYTNKLNERTQPGPHMRAYLQCCWSFEL